jgi:hypothetical protein
MGVGQMPGATHAGCGDRRREPGGGLWALLGYAAWLRALLDPLVAALRNDAFFQPPLRIGGDGRRMGMVLARNERATVTLSVMGPGGDPATAQAGGRVQLLRYVRAGGAALELRPVAGDASRITRWPTAIGCGSTGATLPNASRAAIAATGCA